MAIFTSKRERRLWFWALAVLVAIYSTLGLAGTLVEELRNREMLNSFYVASAVLVLVVILTQGLKTRPGGVEIAVFLGVAIAYFMVFVRMGIPEEERTHLIEYGVLAVFIYQALSERGRNRQQLLTPAVIALGATTLLGWLDEGIQAILPNRVYDIRDVGFNALAGLMSISASLVLTWVRRRLGKARID